MHKNANLRLIYDKIDTKLLGKISNDNSINLIFKILCSYYIIAAAEYYYVIKKNLSLSKKISALRVVLPEFYDDILFWEEIYAEMSRIFERYKGENFEDPLGYFYQSFLSQSQKKGRGVVFTPIVIADYILSKISYPILNGNPETENIIDLSCGSGIFLVRAINKHLKLTKNKESANNVISYIETTVVGFDVDPIAVMLSKTNIIVELMRHIQKSFPLERELKLRIYCTNSLKKTDERDSEAIIEAKKSQYRFVIGNPPYVESKKMDSESKSICRQFFPSIAKGGFDLYLFFVDLGINLLQEGGKLGFIIPNKFLNARYAKPIREKIIKNGMIKHIVNLAHQKVFNPAVYPIILILQNNKQKENSANMLSKIDVNDLLDETVQKDGNDVDLSIFANTINKTIYFADKLSYDIVRKTFSESNNKLSDFVNFRWTISFHRKGLREMFISKKPVGEFPVKFLGGKPFAGNREVERYSLNWWGYWLDYNKEKAKGLKNNFPNIKIFEEKKIIICQHALRIRATIDKDGYVCKDIFLLGQLTEKSKNAKISLEYILGIVNSTLYSFIYKIMYSGTEIMGQYLHYLPMYLHDLPFKKPSDEVKTRIETYVKQLLENEKSAEKQLYDSSIDNEIYELYKLNENKESIEQFVAKYLFK